MNKTRTWKPSPSTALAMIALFVALAGTAWAAGLAKNSVKSKQIKDGQVKGQDIADNAVSSPKVADGSLLSTDFAAGELPAGAQGEQGAQGIQGPPGPSTGPAGGDLAGNYPDPAIAAGAVDGSDIADGSVGGVDLDPATVADVVSAAGTFADDGADHVLMAGVAGDGEVSAQCDATGATILLRYKNNGAASQQVLMALKDAGDANPGAVNPTTLTTGASATVSFGTFTGPAEGWIWASEGNRTIRISVGIAHGTVCRYWAQAVIDRG